MAASVRPTQGHQGRLHIAARLQAPAVGWFYAALFGSPLLVITVSHEPPWKQALGSAVIASLWAGALWLIPRLFLAPWRWLRLIGARR